jgi:uncharacterized membrane protein
MSNQPKKTQNQPARQVEQLVMQKHYQGVIPSPDMMEHYARIDPDLPNRIMLMAEKEGEDRRKRDRKALGYGFTVDLSGIISGIIVVGGVIWLCTRFIDKGFAKEGAWVAGSVMVALAAVFVTRKYSRQNNGSNK